LRSETETFYIKSETRPRLRLSKIFSRPRWDFWFRDRGWDIQDRDRDIFRDLTWTVGPQVFSKLPWQWPVHFMHL